MTTVTEREIGYKLVDARPPLTISTNPADFPPFDPTEDTWRYLPKKKFNAFISHAPASGNSALTMNGKLLKSKISNSSSDSLRTRDLASARAIHDGHDQYEIVVDKASTENGLIELDLNSDLPSNVLIHIVVKREVTAQLIIRDRNKSDTALNISLTLENAANVDCVLFTQPEAIGAHYGHVSVNFGRDAKLNMGVISLGGDIVRRTFDSKFADVSGELDLLGCTFSSKGQYVEHRTVVDHNEPHCKSFVDFRSAVSGDGTRSVWIGDTIIRKNAVGSNTYETNRNLVLTPGARADSVPNLEIDTGEVVGAGHASATGRLDAEQMFYLTSRGIAPLDAMKLIVTGFFANIVERMNLPSIVEDVVSAVANKLEISVVK